MTRHSTSRPGRHAAALGLAGLLLAACGTTVPISSTARTTGGDGLGSTSGAQLPGASTGQGSSTTGDGGAVTPTGGSTGAGTMGASDAGGSTGLAPASQGPTDLPGGQPGTITKAPIKLGFMLIDYSSVAASFGFSGSADVFQAFKEMVVYLNRHGGLAGRQIKPDYYAIDGSSSNATTAYQAACSHFIQDDHVEAVISDGNFNPTFEACMAKAHLAHIDVSTYGLDSVGQRQYPAYLTPTAFAVDRYSVAEVQSAVANGFVKKGDKIGVMIEGCDANVRAYNNAWVPTAKQYGLPIESEQTVCNNGTGDLGSETSQIQAAVLKFRSDGVKTVSFVSFNEGFIAVLFAQGAQQQGWHPQYLMSSVALPERGVESQGSGLSVPAAQLTQIRGLGWVPISDVASTAPGSAAQEAAKRFCKVMSPSQGGAAIAPDSGVRRDFIGHYLRECDTLLLVRNIMALTGGSVAPSAMRSVYANALGSLVSASDLNGAYRIVGSRTDGVFAAAPFAYNTGCKCMRYTGATRTFS